MTVLKSKLNFFENVAVKVIKSGPIPKHISLIMDGNRTYSKKNKIELKDGYELGFKKALNIMNWCLDIGIKHLSVYAFSIENFNRSVDEVTLLMDIARQKVRNLLTDETIIANGIRIRFLGKLSMLPKDLVEIMDQVMEKTKNGKNLTFNLMFAYTSRDEISHSMKINVENNLRTRNYSADITEKTITKSLYLEQPVDILIRSSGVTRLSDYMMWQADSSPLCFVENTWPDVGIWHILISVFYYQVTYKRLMSVKKCLLEC